MTVTITSTTLKAKDLSKFMNRVMSSAKDRGLEAQDTVIVGTARQLFGAIVEETPIGDFDPEHEGTARGSWEFKIGNPSGGFGRRNIGKTGADLRIPKRGLVGKVLFLVSSVPYMPILEFGGYPDPVKRGTFNKRTGRFEIRSVAGFSKQAPAGMIRRNILQLKRFVKRAAKAAA